MRTLDRNRPYASYFPASLAAYEQDGVQFDGAGNEVAGPAPGRRADAGRSPVQAAPAPPVAPIVAPAPDTVANMDWPTLRNTAVTLGVPNVMTMKKADVEQAVRAKFAALQQLLAPAAAGAAQPAEAEKAA